LNYDYLIIATGTKTYPEETPGLKDKLWYREIFDFYTIEGAIALQKFFKGWEGGKLVMAITELPYKCPVAPLEFVFLADAYFTEKGIRDKVDITYVTPMTGAFTKPVATKMLSELLEEKNIKVVPDFYIERVDNDSKKLVSYDEREIPFDVLTVVPVNMGDEMVERSGLGDDMNFVPTNKQTLQSEQHENIFVLGDASNIPTSKAGSVAHFAAEILFENLTNAILLRGKELPVEPLMTMAGKKTVN
jgi:sulfide:quinone oxidoreductase